MGALPGATSTEELGLCCTCCVVRDVHADRAMEVCTSGCRPCVQGGTLDCCFKWISSCARIYLSSFFNEKKVLLVEDHRVHDRIPEVSISLE